MELLNEIVQKIGICFPKCKVFGNYVFVNDIIFKVI